MLACHSRACPSKDSGLRLTPREAALAVLSPFVAVLLRASSASRDRATPAEAPSAAEGEGTTAAPRPFVQGGRKRPSRSFLPRPSAGFGIPRARQPRARE